MKACLEKLCRTRSFCVVTFLLPKSNLYGYRCPVVLRLRPALIRASRVLPSTPPLSQRVERHFLLGQFGGLSVSGIHLWPQTSHTAIRILVQPMSRLYRILPIGHYMVDVWASPTV
jgi:hypothetical protein